MGLLRSGGSSGSRRLSTITAFDDRSRMLRWLNIYYFLLCARVAHNFFVSPYLAQGPSSPSNLLSLISPMDSLLALLQLLLGGSPPVGSPPCLRMYNHNISTLKINIIKTYSYLYAVYSRNILVPEGLMSVLMYGLGEGFERGCGWFWQAWNSYSLIEFGITTLLRWYSYCTVAFPHITTASNVRKCHTTFWPSNVQYIYIGVWDPRMQIHNSQIGR